VTADVVGNLCKVKQKIARAAVAAGRKPEDITLVAVSKNASADAVARLVAAGHRDFGENRVQEGLRKMERIARPDVNWHLIGRVQTNKVKYIGSFHLLHSLDRWRLAVKLSEYALRTGQIFRCLVQVNVSEDPAKAGIEITQVDQFLHAVAGLGGISIHGLMTITAVNAEPGQTFQWFKALADKFAQLREGKLPAGAEMKWLSMGMSADFELAIAAGANMVRVGSAIFAEEGE